MMVIDGAAVQQLDDVGHAGAGAGAGLVGAGEVEHLDLLEQDDCDVPAIHGAFMPSPGARASAPLPGPGPRGPRSPRGGAPRLSSSSLQAGAARGGATVTRRRPLTPLAR